MFSWFKKTLTPYKGIENTAVVEASVASMPIPKNTMEILLAEGYAQLDNANWAAAEKCFRQALAIESRHFLAQFNLGYALFELGNFDESIKYISRSILIRASDNPEKVESLAEAHYFLAQSFLATNQPSEAIKNFESAITLMPNQAIYHSTLGFVYAQQLLLHDAIACYRKAIALEPNLKDAYSNLLLNLQYQNSSSQAELFEEHLKFGKLVEAPLNGDLPEYKNQLYPKKVLRVGYLSADFNQHSVALFMVPVLANHNEEHVETFCYYNNTTQDSITKSIKFLADHFIECAEISDAALFDLIQQDEIDILVDLSGYLSHGPNGLNEPIRIDRLRQVFIRSDSGRQCSRLIAIDRSENEHGNCLISMLQTITNLKARFPGQYKIQNYEVRLLHHEGRLSLAAILRNLHCHSVAFQN